MGRYKNNKDGTRTLIAGKGEDIKWITKEQWDAMTPEQKSDPNVTYGVRGLGSPDMHYKPLYTPNSVQYLDTNPKTFNANGYEDFVVEMMNANGDTLTTIWMAHITAIKVIATNYVDRMPNTGVLVEYLSSTDQVRVTLRDVDSYISTYGMYVNLYGR